MLTDIPLEFKALKICVTHAIAMTINKAQGTCLKVARIGLENSSLSHGQVNAACSKADN